jgi:hypothetical protein
MEPASVCPNVVVVTFLVAEEQALGERAHDALPSVGGPVEL